MGRQQLLRESKVVADGDPAAVPLGAAGLAAHGGAPRELPGVRRQERGRHDERGREEDAAARARERPAVVLQADPRAAVPPDHGRARALPRREERADHVLDRQLPRPDPAAQDARHPLPRNSSSVRFRLMASGDGLGGGYDSFPYTSEVDRVTAARALRHMERDAEESAHMLSLLFREHNYILSDFRQELVARRAKLREKVYFLETIRFKMEEPIETSNPEHVKLLKRLWDGLLPDPNAQEEDKTVVLGPGDDESIDVTALLASKRWKLSGFHTENPLGGFRGGGVLSLETLVYFVEEYPAKAKSMMARNAVAGGNRYPFPVASINVMRMMMKLLMLDEAPDVCSKLVLHSADENIPTTVLKMRIAERVSRTPFWSVFNDPLAFFKLQSMAFMLLDLHWIHSGATQMGFQPVLDATRRQMGWLLEQSPASVEDMWTKWMEMREQHAAKYTPIFSTGSGSSSDNTGVMTTVSTESDDLVEQMLLLLKEKEAEAAMAAAESFAPETQELELALAPIRQHQQQLGGDASLISTAPIAKEDPPSLSTGSPSTREEPSLASVPISNELAQAY